MKLNKNSFIYIFCGLAAIPSTASAQLLWDHTGGLNSSNNAASGEVIANYSSGSSNVLLSYGTLTNTADSSIVGYTVTLDNAVNLGSSSGATTTNNAFTIDSSGNASFFSDIDSTDSSIQFTVDFFSYTSGGVFDTAGNEGVNFSTLTSTAVALSLTSPFSQPSIFDPAGADVRRLRGVELLDIAAINPLGGNLFTSKADPFEQLQTGLSAPSGFDATFGWEAAGFGNDLDNSGFLEVNEALFTLDLSPAEGYTFRRDNDEGQRSVISFTTSGFTPNGSIPEPSIGLLTFLSGALLLGCRRRG